MECNRGISIVCALLALLLLAGLMPVVSDPVEAASAPSPPLNVTVWADNEGIYINWTAPTSDGGSPIDHYLVYLSAGDPENYTYGMHCSFGEGTSLSTYVETNPNWGNLTGGWTYRAWVIAVNAYGESDSSQVVTITPFFGPDMPEDLQLLPGDGYITITWSPPLRDGGKPVIAYDYQRFSLNETYYQLDWLNDTFSASTFSYNDTGLTNGAQYWFYVRARNEIGQGWTWGLLGTPGVPLPPQNLSYAAGIDYVNLTWSPPLSDGGFPVISYDIYRDNSFIASVPANNTYFNDTSAQTGNYYSYVVRAVNSVGASDYSNYVSVTMPYPPGQIWALIPFTGDGYVDLLWFAASDGGSPIIEYRVCRYQWNQTGGYAYNWYNLSVPPTNITTFIGYELVHFNDTSVTNGVVYNYTAWAVNAIGEGEAVSTSIRVGVSSPPYNLYQSGSGNMCVEMMWEPPYRPGSFPILAYNIYRDSALLTSVPADTTYYKDETVVMNVYYTYYITAVNQVGESDPSDPITVMAQRLPPPATNVQVHLGEGYVNVTWTPPEDMSNVKGYMVERCPAGGGSVVSELVYAPSTYYHDSADLTAGASYWYDVITISLEDARSDQFSMATADLPNVPGVPRNIVITSGEGSITLTWSAPTDDGGSDIANYMIYRGFNATSMTWLANVTASEYIDTSVVAEETYFYKVVAVNSFWPGPSSETVDATVLASEGGIDTTTLIIVVVAIVVIVALLAYFVMRPKK